MGRRIGRGGTIVLTATFADATGLLVEPGTPTVEVLDPDDVQIVAPVTPTRNPATGLHEHDLTVPLNATFGSWTARWSGTINGVAVTDDDQFDVVAAGDIDFAPGASAPLADAADLLLLVGVTAPTDADTARAELLVRLASGMVREAAKQTFTLVQDDVVLLRGSHGDMLALPERPVVGVAAVTIDGYAVADWTLEAGDRLRRGRTDAGRQYNVYSKGCGGSWGGPDCTVAVTYSHGRTTAPDDVVTATLMAAAGGWANPTGLLSMSIGTYSESYGGIGPYERGGIRLPKTEVARLRSRYAAKHT